MIRRGVYAAIFFMLAVALAFAVRDEDMYRFWQMVRDNKLSDEAFEAFIRTHYEPGVLFIIEQTAFEQRKRWDEMSVLVSPGAGEKPQAALAGHSNYLLLPSPKELPLSRAVTLAEAELGLDIIAVDIAQVDDIVPEPADASWMLYRLGRPYKGVQLTNALASISGEQRPLTLRAGLALLLVYADSISEANTFQLVLAGSRVVRADGERRIPVIHVYEGDVKLIALRESIPYVLGAVGLATSYDYSFSFFETLFDD